MEKPTRGLVAWGEWGSSLVDESGSPPLKRWVVHHENVFMPISANVTILDAI